MELGADSDICLVLDLLIGFYNHGGKCFQLTGSLYKAEYV